MKKQLLFILLLICFTSPAFSQQSQIYLDPALRYKEGQELFIEKNFLSAREKFEAAKSKTAKKGSNTHTHTQKKRTLPVSILRFYHL